MGTAVGVSVRSGASVGEISVEVGIDVSVAIVGEVGDGEEQEERSERKRKACTEPRRSEERMRDATC